MSVNWQHLESLDDEQVVEEFNRAGTHAAGGVSFYQAYLFGRLHQRQAEAVTGMTGTMLRLTKLIAVLTVANVVLAGVSAWVVLSGS